MSQHVAALRLRRELCYLNPSAAKHPENIIASQQIFAEERKKRNKIDSPAFAHEMFIK
jgi:hypothetical protein